jgi:FkbM family methyltransferase
MSSFEETWLPVDELSGDIALDIGANVGQWSFELSSKFKNVVAVEPQPGCAEQMLARIRLWDKYSNVDVITIALAGSPGYWMFNTYPDSKLSGFSPLRADAPEGPNGRFFPKTERLDDLTKHLLFKARSVDFVKIDVEGSEEIVLLGGLGFLATYKPKTICVECHSVQPGEECFNLLQQHLGYNVKIIRHPAYEQDSPEWHGHFWLWATARV